MTKKDGTMEGLYCESDKFDFEKRYCLTVAHLPLSPQLDCEVVVDFFFSQVMRHNWVVCKVVAYFLTTRSSTHLF